jgi:hypothetical protein
VCLQQPRSGISHVSRFEAAAIRTARSYLLGLVVVLVLGLGRLLPGLAASARGPP